MRKKETIRFPLKKTWQFIVALLMLLLAYVFFRNERHELAGIIPELRDANIVWLLFGIAASGIFIALQSVMYVVSFKAVGLPLSFSDAVELFLKRNFLSVFLPAGGVSSLAYLPDSLRKRRLNIHQVHQASAIYGYTGFLTIILVGAPVVFYTLLTNRRFGDSWIWLLLLTALLGIVLWAALSFRHKGILQRLVEKKHPDLAAKIHLFFSGKVDKKSIYETILYSTLVEFACIAIVYTGMRAVGVAHSLEAAAVSYIISVIFMSVSPFLRGLGAVEFSLLFIFQKYGYSSEQSLSITMFYRILEFWLPLLLGVFTYVWRGRQILVRIVPAIFIFSLGIVNVISVATPPLSGHWREMMFYLPVEALHLSYLMTLALGISLIYTSVYLIKGFKTAWLLGVVFSLLSVITHLMKGLDYGEAVFAVIVIFMLIISRKQYPIHSSKKWVRFGFGTFLMVLASVCIFDFISFYLIDKHHFGIDFSWKESLRYTIGSFLLFADSGLTPHTRFGTELVYVVRFLGFSSWLLLFYTLLQPAIFHAGHPAEKIVDADRLLSKYGRSPNDYFKIQGDKQLFFSHKFSSFTSFRAANNFAVVLEEPVCDVADRLQVINEFEQYCRSRNLRPVYYRVNEDMLPLFRSIRKKAILIGQEAVVDVAGFTLEGGERKSLRNALHTLERKGFSTSVFQPPHSDSFLSGLKAVSDDWLKKFDKKEMVFSQGMFDAGIIRDQPVIAVTDKENEPVSFLNIIPDWGSGECTYDLIRRTENAPGGCIDAMIVQLIGYAGAHGFQLMNMGMAPLSGIRNPDNTAEQIIQFASQKITSLKHFQSLQFFKEKYARDWRNKYLVYEDDIDLLQMPAALKKVMKPQG